MNFAHVRFPVNTLHLKMATLPVSRINHFYPRNKNDFNPSHVYTVPWSLKNGKIIDLRCTIVAVGSRFYLLYFKCIIKFNLLWCL